MVTFPAGPNEFFRLSPDEREALSGFAVLRGDARARLDVNYSALGPSVEGRLARSRYPVQTIGSLEKRLQYGCSKRADVDPVGLPILRMSNMQPDGWDLSELKYVELTDKERDLWLLDHGDILFNRTNSKELVGKCEVFKEPGEWVFASYLMRLTVDTDIDVYDLPKENTESLGALKNFLVTDYVQRTGVRPVCNTRLPSEAKAYSFGSRFK